MRERKKGKAALLQTTKDFAEKTSIHGIGYVFDRSLKILDRLLWLVLVLAFLCLATALTWNTWTQWREEQVAMMLSLSQIERLKNTLVFTIEMKNYH